MKRVLDAFWRAVAYCMHPRVIGLSFLPLLLMVALAWGLGYWFWDAAVASVMQTLEAYDLVRNALDWLESLGLSSLRAGLAPLLVLALATPAIVLLCLALVALFMTPAMVRLVSDRRFAALEQKRGGSLLVGALWSLGSALLALLVFVITLPLWLVPPLVLILPPLIWGWLTYRVFAFDALAQHASADERRALLKQHRGSLLLMGIVSGYLGAAPTLLWATSAVVVVLAPLLVGLAIWIYTLVFAFASLWFAHFALAALAELRATPGVDVLDPLPRPGTLGPVSSLPSAAPGPAGSAQPRLGASWPASDATRLPPPDPASR